MVAPEFKSLAGQTAKATEVTTAPVAGIKGATEGMVSAVGTIGGSIRGIDAVSTAITGAAGHQATATGRIHESVQRAVECAGTASRNIAGVGDAAQATDPVAATVRAHADALASQTGTLSREAARFVATVRAG